MDYEESSDEVKAKQPQLYLFSHTPNPRWQERMQ